MNCCSPRKKLTRSLSPGSSDDPLRLSKVRIFFCHRHFDIPRNYEEDRILIEIKEENNLKRKEQNDF